VFYKNNGGITLSGGEPLLHLDFCLELAKKCKTNKINLAFDTSGSTFNSKNLNKFKQLIKFNPLFIVDIKHIDENKHKIITGVQHQNELDLINFLEKNKKKY
jgi:pyruvate formate lyase activating enzyme